MANKKVKHDRLSKLATPLGKNSEESVVRPNRAGPRQLPKTKFQAYVQRKNEAKKGKVAGSIHLFFRTLILLRDNWEVFLGIGIVYMIIDVVLVRGLSTVSLTGFKAANDQRFHGLFGNIQNGLSLFATLLSNPGGSSSTSNTSAGIYQGILIILISLAIVWCLRQSYNKIRVTVTESFYKGMYPLIVVLLVLMVLGLELVPLVLGSVLFSNLIGGKIVFSVFQKVVVGGVTVALIFPTFYMLCSSIFALYIATLPDMTPVIALRSARELVRHRRLLVLRKLLFIPIAIFVVLLVIMLPILILLTPIAPWVFFILSTAGIIFLHGYMYSLYRELI
jgi:hypothetical protein